MTLPEIISELERINAELGKVGIGYFSIEPDFEGAHKARESLVKAIAALKALPKEGGAP